jgi:peroxiredoxin
MDRRNALSVLALSAAACRRNVAAAPPPPPAAFAITPHGAAAAVESAQALARGPLVVAFHREHWCPTCATPLAEVQANLAAFDAAGATVWGLTLDPREDTTRTVRALGLSFPFATDPGGHAARALSVDDENVVCVIAPGEGNGRVVFREAMVPGNEREVVAAALAAVRSATARPA